MIEWIDCIDRLPNRNQQEVLICIGGNGFFIATYNAPQRIFETMDRHGRRDFVVPTAPDIIKWAELNPCVG